MSHSWEVILLQSRAQSENYSRLLPKVASEDTAAAVTGKVVQHGPATTMIPTPELSHLTRRDYDLVYEPAGTKPARFAQIVPTSSQCLQRQKTPLSSSML